MITVMEALAIAKEKRSGIDFVTEYENGFVFSGSSDAGYIGGLNHSPVVVLKENGAVTDMISFVNAGMGEEISKQSI